MTTNAIGTTGTTATGAIGASSDDGAPSPVNDLGTLLPAPGAEVNTDLLMGLLIKSASDTRKIHSANRDIAAQQREAAQNEEVEKLHEAADSALVSGVMSGAMQIGSAGLQGASASSQNEADAMKLDGGDKANPTAWKAAADSAKDYKVQAEVSSAMSGFYRSTGDATSKDLEADGKSAAAKASSAKDAYDNESDEMHAQRDLKDAILKAYDALIGVKAQNAGAFLAPAQRG